MKKIIAISSALFVVIFLAGCSLQPVSQTPSATSTAVAQQPEQPTATTTPATDETANWLTYTNKELGVEFQYPNTGRYSGQWPSADCEIWKDKDFLKAKNSAQAKDDLIMPYVVLSADNHIYISTKYFYHENSCEKFEAQIDPVAKKVPTNVGSDLHIVVSNVKNEKEIDSFIKTTSGAGCAYNGKEKTTHEGTYKIVVGVAEEYKNRDELNKLNFPCAYFFSEQHFYYSPEQNKIAYWTTGQDWFFELNNKSLDDDMANTFQFLK